jgi:hypothetical protein
MTFQFFKCQNDISNEIPLFSNHFHFIQNGFLINLIDLDNFFLSIVNALYRLRITDQLFKSYAFTPVSGAISIGSPTPTSTPNLKKKHPLYLHMYYYYDARTSDVPTPPVAIAHPNLRGHSRFDELYVRGGYDFDSVRFFVSLLTQANKRQTTVTVNQILTQ